MAINIYNSVNFETIVFLCDDDWDLPSQLDILYSWVKENRDLLKGEYVADIGFSIRKEASGGGGVMDVELMKILVDIGMEIHFSEYLFLEDNGE